MQSKKIKYDILREGQKTDYYPLTKQKIQNHRWMVLVFSILVIICDILTIIFLAAADASFLGIPISLLVIDALFIGVIYITNFKVKRSIYPLIVYIVLSLILTIAMLSQLISFAGTYMTILYFLLFLIMHIILYISLGFSVKLATQTNNLKTKVSFSVLASIGILIVVSFLALNIVGGFLGQGNSFITEEKNLVYSYDSVNGYYVVNGVTKGFGDKIVIPETFDGKPVGAIDCDVFTQENIKSITIDGEEARALLNLEKLVDFPLATEVFASIETIDAYRYQILSIAKSYYDEASWYNSLEDSAYGAARFANAFAPHDLAEDQVYITFSYKVDELKDALSQEITSTWVGKKGEVFQDLTQASEDGEVYNDETNQQHLAWNYNQSGKIRILKDSSGKSIEGKPVYASTKVSVQFAKIYTLQVEQGNDSLFLDTNWNSGKEGGVSFFIIDQANDLIQTLPKREGFDVNWKAKEHSAYYYDVDLNNDLEAFINDNMTTGSKIKIRPLWEMKNPTIDTIESSGANGVSPNDTYTYGEETINVNTKATGHGIKLEYALYKDGDLIERNEDGKFSLNRLTPGDSSFYSVKVRAKDKNISSLQSADIIQNIYLTIKKKELDFTWNYQNNAKITYNAEDFEIKTNHQASDLVFEDVAKYSVSLDNIRDAKSYTINLALEEDTNQKYEIKLGKQNLNITVLPKPLEITWTNTNFTYDATEKIPTAQALALGSDKLNLNVSGKKINANIGSTSYTAYASITNTNYTLSNPSQGFKINPCSVSVVWEDVASFVYNGTFQSPGASANGIDSYEIPIEVGNKARNVGNDYQATASTTDTNYSLANNLKAFKITPLEKAVNWGSNSFVYNAKNQAPTANIDAIAGDYVVVSVSGAKKDVGSGYEAQASIGDANYTLINKTKTFEITQKSLTVTWGSATFTYNRTAQKPTAHATPLLDDVLGLSVSGEQTNAGENYEAQANITNANYKLSNPKKTFVIDKKVATITWGNTTLTYDSNLQIPSASVSGVISPDDLGLTYSGQEKSAGSGYLAKAEITNENYVLSNSQISFSISTYGINIIWTNITFTYDTTDKISTATASGLGLDDLGLSVDGKRKNAGEGNAIASITNANYHLINSNQAFTISQAAVDVTWGATNFEYNATEQKPTATATAIGSDTLGLVVSGGRTNAGAGNAIASITNTNYYLTNPTKSFNIDKKLVSVVWGDITSFEYNASLQAPTATATGIDSYSIPLTITGKRKNVGNHTAAANTNDENYGLINATKKFSITALSIAVSWGSTTLTYNGSNQIPSFTVTPIDGDDLALLYSGLQKNVGEGYTAEITSGNDNYVLTNNSTNFTINKKNVQFVWNTQEITLGEDPPVVVLTGKEYANDCTNISYTLYDSGDNVILSIESTGQYKIKIAYTSQNYNIENDMLEFDVVE